MIELSFTVLKLIFLKFLKYKIIFINCSRIGGYYDLIWERRTKKKNKIIFVGFSPNSKIANKVFHLLLLEDFNFIYIKKNYILYRIFNKINLINELDHIIPNNFKELKNIFGNKDSFLFNSVKNKIDKNYNYKYVLNKKSLIDQSFFDKIDFKKNNYICFHSREAKYLNQEFPNKDWSYHNYRDSNINNYYYALKKFYKKFDIKSFRFGKNTEYSFTYDKNILDLTNNSIYSDELELDFINNSKFVLCSDTGASCYAEYIFKPIVYVNWSNPMRISRWVPNSIFIFKKIRNVKTGKLLSLRETFNIDFNDINYLIKNLEFIENTDDEIFHAISEQYLRLNNRWESSKEDTLMQCKFWELFLDYDYSKSKTFIGNQFLKENTYLL